ncbi:MAG TPA: hypothetical protein VJ602_02000, partial [Paludibacter sp.]|nr:hypothetical protein [Paludibacter sp.]
MLLGLSITGSTQNASPVLGAIEGTPLGYTENDGAVAITSSITVTDVDNTNMASAIVQITSNYVNGQDILAFTNQNGITGSWITATGVLNLSGSATKANYETALRSVTYTNTSQNPTALTRTVTYTVNDGSIDSNTQTRDITVAAVNNAPVLATVEGTAIYYTENTGAVAITSSITVTDVDNINMASAIVQITSNYVNGQD